MVDEIDSLLDKLEERKSREKKAEDQHTEKMEERYEIAQMLFTSVIKPEVEKREKEIKDRGIEGLRVLVDNQIDYPNPLITLKLSESELSFYFPNISDEILVERIIVGENFVSVGRSTKPLKFMDVTETNVNMRIESFVESVLKVQ